MRYHIMAPNMDLPERMQDGLLRKLQKLERFVKHFPDDAVNVDATVDRHQRTQDFVVSVRLGLTSAVLVSKEQAPTLEQAANSAVDDIRDQLERYMAKLRGEAAISRRRQPLPSEAQAEVGEPLLESRELYDRAIAGDRDAFDQLMEGSGFAVRRVMNQELQRHGVEDGPEKDALFEELLGQALADAHADLARKPSRMSVAGWLGLKARKAVEDHLRRMGGEGISGAA